MGDEPRIDEDTKVEAMESEDPAALHGDPDDAEEIAAGAALGFAPAAAAAPIPWRVAKALLTLRGQINALAPGRSKASDGTIGDTNHQNRNSDHNPHVIDGANGVVTALDITHDPAHGCDAGKVATSLHASRDPRIKYIIWNRKIAASYPVGAHGAWVWRTYGGSNPHTRHVHISVIGEKAKYDAQTPWTVGVV